MEKLKVKHDHRLTDIIKVCMFSLFLILPILMFLPNALYYGFNEHANHERQVTTGGYNVEQKYTTNEVNTLNDIEENKVYKYNDTLYLDNSFTNPNQSFAINLLYCSNLYYDTENYTIDEIYNDEYNAKDNNTLQILISRNGTYTTYYTNLNIYVSVTIDYIEIKEFDFYLQSDIDLNNFKNWFNSNQLDINKIEKSTFKDYNVTYIPEETKTLDIAQSLAYSWQETWQQPVFNWTGTNNFSFTIKAFTNVFGITQESYIANYLCYIMTLIVIYIIYDIIITLFTKMTHILNE